MSARRSFAREERGAATIEFVLTVPLFLVALALTFEMGRFFIAHQTTVSNVRSAARFLSRSDLSAADKTAAETIVRTGEFGGSDEPDYLSSTSATITITDPYATFTDATFNVNGKTIHVHVRVEFPLLIFGFVSPGAGGTLPFVVVEDERYIGV